MIAVRRRIHLLACLLALAALPAHAERVEYAVDPVHTRVAFTAGHAGFSRAIGTFAGTTGTLVFDEADWKSSKVDVTIPVTSLDLGDAAWKKAVLGNMFLDADKLANARFVSTSVEDLGGGKLRITGDLTLHGVTQPVVLDATFNAHRKHPLTFKRTAGFSATTTLSRKAFKVVAWPGVIDDRIDVMIEVEAAAPKKTTNKDATRDGGAEVPGEPIEPPWTDQEPGNERKDEPAPAPDMSGEAVDDASDPQ
jgi:polyisoprenoid-binding protein YceI